MSGRTVPNGAPGQTGPYWSPVLQSRTQYRKLRRRQARTRVRVGQGPNSQEYFIHAANAWMKCDTAEARHLNWRIKASYIVREFKGNAK